MRTSGGLAVNIPLPWLSLKIAGLVIMCVGLAGLRIPQQVGGWLSRNQDRLLEAIDPVADAEDGPRAPLDALLDSGMSQQ